ncbi:MAG: ABC-2 family transporter protein [Candidatus Binatia bacterium]|nr:ABC-2 family transporter protein [Candidatus Binatia bacterium]
MIPYTANFRVGFQLALAYRRAAAVWVVGELSLLVVFYFLWRAVFLYAPAGSFSDRDFAAFYLYLLTARLTARFTGGPAWGFFAQRVREGTVVYDLVQPVELEYALLARWLGQKVGQLLMALPVYAAAMFVSVAWSAGEWRWGWFLLSLVVGFACAYFFEFLMSLSAFYTSAQQGINEAKALVVALLSGAFFPLDLLPDPYALLAGLLPFQAFIYLPARMLHPSISESEIFHGLAVQLFWLLALAASSRFLLGRVRQRFNAQGG